MASVSYPNAPEFLVARNKHEFLDFHVADIACIASHNTRFSIFCDCAICQKEPCSICTEPFDRANHRGVRLRGCQHEFGRSCIIRLINSITETRNRCPLCRAELFILTAQERQEATEQRMQEEAEDFDRLALEANNRNRGRGRGRGGRGLGRGPTRGGPSRAGPDPAGRRISRPSSRESQAVRGDQASRGGSTSREVPPSREGLGREVPSGRDRPASRVGLSRVGASRRASTTPWFPSGNRLGDLDASGDPYPGEGGTNTTVRPPRPPAERPIPRPRTLREIVSDMGEAIHMEIPAEDSVSTQLRDMTLQDLHHQLEILLGYR